MKKSLLLSTALVMLAGSAIAADLPVKAPIVAPLPGCAQFGGFYVGGNVGWKYRNNDWTDKDGYAHTTFAFTDSLGVATHGSESANSWEAGVQSGYNFQFHCTVFGIQGDWNWTDAKVSSFYTARDNVFAPFDLDTHAYSSKEQWFGTLRGRSGVVVDNLLLYVTGGLAWANFHRDHTYFFSGAGNPFSQTFNSSQTRLGFVVGAGTEWALNANWSVVSEILYMGFEKDNRSYACVPGVTCSPAAGQFRYEYRDTEWVARVGVNYRWGGWGAPLLARY